MSYKELFGCDYPIYTVGRLGDGDETEFYVAGGGGEAKTGIPNCLDVQRLSYENGTCVSVPVHHHDMGTRVIMNSAPHPRKGYQMAVGVGGKCISLDLAKKSTGSPKKEPKVKRRKKSKSDDEDSGSTNTKQSLAVMATAEVQTDFSDECYQKVVTFTCDGGRVVTGGSDGVVRVWKYPSLEKLCQLEGHKTEIETLSSHPSKQQVVSGCRGGRAIVWDLTNQDQEHTFNWSPGQRPGNVNDDKPTYRFRNCCFSPSQGGEDGAHGCVLYTTNIPVSISSKDKKCCYLVKWDAEAWVVDEQTTTGKELLSALAIDESGRYLGVGTISGSILIYSSDLKPLSRVPSVHTVFVTGLLFLSLPTKSLTKSPAKPAEKSTSSDEKRVSKPEKQVLISVSADRTCCAIPVQKKSGKLKLILFFIFMLFVILLVAMAIRQTKLSQ